MRPPYELTRLPEYLEKKRRLIREKREIERQLKFTNLAIGHLRNIESRESHENRNT